MELLHFSAWFKLKKLRSVCFWSLRAKDTSLNSSLIVSRPFFPLSVRIRHKLLAVTYKVAKDVPSFVFLLFGIEKSGMHKNCMPLWYKITNQLPKSVVLIFSSGLFSFCKVQIEKYINSQNKNFSQNENQCFLKLRIPPSCDKG